MTSRYAQGFTILECLLVVGILGLLIGVLLPMMRGLKEDAWDADCKAHLRQMAQVCTAFAQSTGEYPWGMKNVSGYSSYCWDFKRPNGGKDEPGDMWEGLNFGSVVCCPKCRDTFDNWNGGGYTGYNYNCAYVGKVVGDRATRESPLRWIQVKQADKLPLFGDGGYSGGPNKFMRATQASRDWDYSGDRLREAGTQAFRHKGHANISFADGHVESCHRPYTTSGKEGWVSEKAKTAFVGENNDFYGKMALGL